MDIYKGIFWWIGSQLICRKVMCDSDGLPLEAVEFTSKSGDNFNHKAEWEKFSKKITDGNPYNYYPRGRVEIKRGKATVYLNPALNRPEVTRMIHSEFGLDALSAVVIKNDGSAHYETLSEKE